MTSYDVVMTSRLSNGGSVGSASRICEFPQNFRKAPKLNEK